PSIFPRASIRLPDVLPHLSIPASLGLGYGDLSSSPPRHSEQVLASLDFPLISKMSGTKILVLSVALLAICAIEARSSRSLKEMFSSIVVSTPSGGPPLTTLVNLRPDPIFKVTAIKANMPNVAFLTDYGRTFFTVEFETSIINVHHVYAFLNITQGAHEYSKKYSMDSFSSICKHHSHKYTCDKGAASLGPILLPRTSDLPAWIKTGNSAMITFSLIADKGTLLLAASFPAYIHAPRPGPDTNSEDLDALDFY
ncbi:hypothetical protein PENTCL1PPCAC_171, partial [Pristionchus entomophagus]